MLIVCAEDPLAQRILAYLRDNPAASDSLRGVRDWWLPGLASSPSDGAVRAALEALAAAGLVSRIENPDGTILWAAGPGLGR